MLLCLNLGKHLALVETCSGQAQGHVCKCSDARVEVPEVMSGGTLYKQSCPWLLTAAQRKGSGAAAGAMVPKPSPPSRMFPFPSGACAFPTESLSPRPAHTQLLAESRSRGLFSLSHRSKMYFHVPKSVFAESPLPAVFSLSHVPEVSLPSQGSQGWLEEGGAG